MLKLKLGLTRNRLFEPSAVVFFGGKYKTPLVEDEVNKALGLLAAKYEIITSLIEYKNGADAFLVSEKVTPKAEFLPLDYNCLKKALPYEGNAAKELFKFCITQDNYFVILAHTVVADGKSLLRLAKDFSLFYGKKNLCVEPEQIHLFPGFEKLPVEVGSPLTDKLAANLDEKWNKKPLTCDLDDYKLLLERYKEQNEQTGEITQCISSEQMKAATAFCQENNLDISALIAFCVYKSLREDFKGDKKEDKIVLTTDRRFFFEKADNFSVGAFDGTVEVSFNKAVKNKPLKEQLKDFQRDFYKSMTSVFRGFYDDVLYMKLIPEFCDAAYLYGVGLNKNAGAGNLAKNYTCLNKKLCRYSFFNLEQMFWSELENFENVQCFDALRMQYNANVSVVLSQGQGSISLKYRTEKISRLKAEKSLEKAVEMLSDFVS